MAGWVCMHEKTLRHQTCKKSATNEITKSMWAYDNEITKSMYAYGFRYPDLNTSDHDVDPNDC